MKSKTSKCDGVAGAQQMQDDEVNRDSRGQHSQPSQGSGGAWGYGLWDVLGHGGWILAEYHSDAG